MSDGVNRRDFLKILGIGAATAAAGCAPGGKPEKIIPYLIPPDDIVPGVAQYYASTCTECPAGCGVMARTREGRATKLEGLAAHPVNRGKLCARGHSALQALYNPDRLAGPQMRTGTSAWKTVQWNEAIATLAGRLRDARGRTALLTGHVTGSMNALLGDVAAATGARRVSYEAFGHEAVRAANALTFGVNGIPSYDIGAARYVLSFGADFLETWISPVEFARGFREHHSAQGTQMGTFVFVAPRLSLTGMNADEWVAIAPGTEGVLALAMVRVMVDEGLGAASGNAALRTASSHYDVRAAAEKTGVQAERIQRLAREFAQGSPSLALVGGTATASAQGTQTAAAVNLLNYAAGAIGRTVHFGPMHSLSSLGTYKDVLDLVAAMNAGEVQALIVADTNPAYSLPAASGFSDAMKKVPFSAVLTPVMTDTAALASLVLPTHHALESWGDAEPREGVFSLIQPVMRPVPVTTSGPTLGTPRFDTKAAGDVLLEAAKAVDPASAAAFPAASYEEYVKARWRTIHAAHGAGQSFEAFWAAAVERGGVFTSVAERSVGLAPGAASVNVNAPALENASAAYTLLPYPHATLYDGRFANRPWLQEQPDPVTKVVWDSWVEMHPNTARKLGLDRGDLVALDTGHGTIRVAAFPYPGIREDVLAIPTGQGHANFGRYAADGAAARGVNVASALPSAMDPASGGRAWLATKVAASKAGGHHPLITTNGDDSQEQANVAQIIPLAALLQSGVAASILSTAPTPGTWAAHTEEEIGAPTRTAPDVAGLRKLPPSQWEAPGAPRVHRWGMAIDLSSCIGCSACAVACYSENNIAIVGVDRVAKHREMAWIRIERYWKGDGESLETRFLPNLCQHCDDAPCEPVCPVFATYHNPEGLNVQLYNRCVGTRYCSNNCPWRVRVFNYFDYPFPEPLNLQLNPDVTVRSKGVMEKCTFCTQRIREAKDRAQDESRALADGDIVPACAQSCPTDAIAFGDLNDPDSRVTQLARLQRGYRMFEELNTRPGITYLKKVTRGRRPSETAPQEADSVHHA